MTDIYNSLPTLNKMTKVLNEEKIRRLKSVLAKIEAYSKDEKYFDEIHDILQKEYNLEGGEYAEYVFGNYRHNLEQTLNKQARTYIDSKKKRPAKGAPSEYKQLITNFKQDINKELGMYRF